MSVLVVGSAIHSVFFALLLILWKRVPLRKIERGASLPVSVIIPFRNERHHLENLIRNLNFLDYPEDDLEILLVDDHSEDGGFEKAISLGSECRFNTRILKLPPEKTGKKSASTLAVFEAKNDIILCTDADCIHEHNWIWAHVNCYLEGRTKMISGPVKMQPKGLFQEIQALEFSGLIAYGGITLSRSVPGMCNGANMSYKRNAFIDVNGYSGNENIPTGDDEFLLQKISKKFPGQVDFLKSREGMVTTLPKETFSELWSQRKRWTSKWKFHQSSFIKVSAVLGFVDFLIGFMLLAVGLQGNPMALTILAIRWFSEWIFLNATRSFSELKISGIVYPTISLIYPLYAVFLGLASIFGKYSWKGRNYR